MPDYGRFCPVALATDVLADRWTPMIVRELVLGNTRFNDIARGLPGISRTLLSQRLRHLEKRGVVERWPVPGGQGSEYHLTPAGKDLERVIDALGRWAIEWLFDELYPQEVDPHTLMWWMHRRIDPTAFPEGRVVLEFAFTAPDPETVWLVLERGEASVCHQHPGFDTDVHLRATTATYSGVFNGLVTWPDAVRSGDLEVVGPTRLVRAVPTWFLWSPWVEVTRERAGRA
ncbi:MAG TPA: helix-turn-helix domain-containing protein [Nocardioides sp.]|uniref:winged helix-turn-helix transcriptional regulator n=1 Tax=uncultured Nocardioides sp. TaxID=198441 RepID=UPI000EC56FA6|nr:helix-turn-helix domain-containing protein [uncultured Nocardioides sp.]HCB03802.1 transcriptional regulator [Nocardioides sp.]HRD63968.1 helix-turn-helix domain-containing protein [Nocardioides sp.]HRI98728.1 helix-turn-helix domain-containing protein [Nocardioides sp.]HRK48207.1 helix-turn-helix domain-containing protein [Nocardioides sp.]